MVAVLVEGGGFVERPPDCIFTVCLRVLLEGILRKSVGGGTSIYARVFTWVERDKSLIQTGNELYDWQQGGIYKLTCVMTGLQSDRLLLLQLSHGYPSFASHYDKCISS